MWLYGIIVCGCVPSPCSLSHVDGRLVLLVREEKKNPLRPDARTGNMLRRLLFGNPIESLSVVFQLSLIPDRGRHQILLVG